MTDRFGIRIPLDFLEMLSQIIGVDVPAMFDETPFLMLTQISIAEFNMRFLSEDQISAECRDDSTIEIVSM